MSIMFMTVVLPLLIAISMMAVSICKLKNKSMPKIVLGTIFSLIGAILFIIAMNTPQYDLWNDRNNRGLITGLQIGAVVLVLPGILLLISYFKGKKEKEQETDNDDKKWNKVFIVSTLLLFLLPAIFSVMIFSFVA